MGSKKDQKGNRELEMHQLHAGDSDRNCPVMRCLAPRQSRETGQVNKQEEALEIALSFQNNPDEDDKERRN